MRKKYKIYIVLGFVFMFSFFGLNVANAATNPNLGAVDSFSVLAQTAITGISTISGDVGMNNTGASISALLPANVSGTIYSTDGGAPSTGVLIPAVQANASTVYTATIPGLPIEGTPIAVSELNGITRGPGVYDLPAGAVTLSGGVLTLDGPGTYIFRITTGLTSSGSINFINGARACDLFWNVGSLATINGTSFAGTILAGTGVHFGPGVTLDGRALAVGGDVTFGVGGTVSGPSCAVPAPSATLTLVKTITNDNSGTSLITDWTLTATGPTVISGVTASGAVTNATVDPGVYALTESGGPAGYTGSTFSCVNGGAPVVSNSITLVDGDDASCTINNNDNAPSGGSGGGHSNINVPPLIDVVKVPNPLALPGGPGSVQYTYTLTNIGTVAVSDITMVGDTCSPIVLISGDVDNDARLDLSETWVYRCSTTLTETHTNTVVTTGWANGISANDITSATVIVGKSVVPPLIHVTKIPSPLALFAGAGMVTYTEKITNPGTVALSNVLLVDDKCSPVRYVAGDIDNDSKLDTNETWTYTCQARLTRTTTNTATATGQANGLTARDFAIATVVVSIPGLPKTGFPSNNSWIIIASISALGLISALVINASKKRKI